MKKIGLVACSNGLGEKELQQVKELSLYLNHIGIEVNVSPYLAAAENRTTRSASGKDRAEILMKYFAEDSIEAIFDVSGGDVANEVLPFLDYDVIRSHPKTFYGYSDLSTVCNAIYSKTGVPTGWFQIRTLAWDETGAQKEWFASWNKRTDMNIEFLHGEKMSGICVGGNIRCFLKLAGTPYFPDLSGKILLLESYGGLMPVQISLLNQLAQMDGFSKLNGIILGNFTEIDKEGQRQLLEKEVLELSGKIPVACTKEIGHGKQCKCVMIGEPLTLEKDTYL